MSNKTAIEALELRLAELERKGNALVEVINDLRVEDGLPPRGPFGTGGASSSQSASGAATFMQIKSDTFYGKKLQTAVREYLIMRKHENAGPATPREIYDAITKGGYQFDTKNEGIALVSLRSLLRKRTAFFHKLPNGTYGLTSWYPDAKKPKNISSAEDDGDDADTETVDKEEEEVETATAKAAAAS